VDLYSKAQTDSNDWFLSNPLSFQRIQHLLNHRTVEQQFIASLLRG
jgi:hypothetical protein